MLQADLNLEAVQPESQIEEVVADKGYHSAATLQDCDDLNFRTYIPEPARKGERKWTDKPAGQQQAVYANRRRLKTDKSKRLQRQRSATCSIWARRVACRRRDRRSRLPIFSTVCSEMY